ncbi:MAG: hypothetical protein ACE5FD_18285, partial [Anaerolineae bacterium]
TALELGDRLGVSLALWVLAEIRNAYGNFLEADALISRAIFLGRALDLNYELCDSLCCAGEVYLKSGQLALAQTTLTEAEQLATDPDQLLKVKLLAARVRQMVTGNEEQPLSELEQLLEKYPALANRAAIYYDIWRLSEKQNKTAAVVAADLYQQLYREIPNLEYKHRYENITGEQLGQPPELPPLPAIIRDYTIKLGVLLPQVDALIQEIKLEAEAGVERTA